MRGLKENVRIQTLSGHAWQWRRICFRFKGTRLFEWVDGSGLTEYLALYRETSQHGFVRYCPKVEGAGIFQSDNAVWINTVSNLFRGRFNNDWTDAMTAPTDNRIMDIVYDKVRTIQSGNENGITRNYKLWHPMNKNLVYADEENGGGKDQSFLSTHSKQGMGDYYVFDIFSPAPGGTNGADDLSFSPEATLYWHER
jgi:hypothetical protein